jgi:hypothetical protein
MRSKKTVTVKTAVGENVNIRLASVKAIFSRKPLSVRCRVNYNKGMKHPKKGASPPLQANQLNQKSGKNLQKPEPLPIPAILRRSPDSVEEALAKTQPA